jgi:hypothetical protein
MKGPALLVAPRGEDASTAGRCARNPCLPIIQTFLRGFLLVTLVSLNTRQVAGGRYVSAFLVGGLISAVWWSNSSAKREQFTGAGALYAFGAACGTVLGMYLGR